MRRKGLDKHNGIYQLLPNRYQPAPLVVLP